MKITKESLRSEIKNAVRGNSSFNSNPEEEVRKLFKEKMTAFIDDVSSSLNRRDSEYSRVVRGLMAIKQEIDQI